MEHFRKFRELLKNPALAGITAFLSIILVVFIVYPVVAVLVKSLFEEGAFTLKNYVDFFSRRMYYRAMFNSFFLAIVTSLITTFVSFNLAYMANLGPRILRPLFRVIAISPVITPPFVFAVALVILGGRKGIIPELLGIEFSLFGWPGVIIAQVLHFIPLCFIVIDNVLKSLNPNLDESAGDLGANQWEIMRTVTIPLASPGLLKGGLLVFILSMADFGNPAVIGGGISLMATDAYLLVVGENNFSMASVFCVLLTVPSLIIYLIQRYYIEEKKFTTITGKPIAVEERKISLGIKVPMLTICTFISAQICVVFAAIIIGAFTKNLGIDNTPTFQHFSLRTNWLLLRNSTSIALYSSFVGAIVGIFLAYLLIRKNIPGRSVIELISLSGFAIPGTVVGIGYLLAFNKPPLYLTGTISIVALSMLFRTLAVSVEAGISKLYQIDENIEEASTDLGAGFLMTFWTIVLPLLSSAFIGGLIYSFMYSINSLSSVVFVTPPRYLLASIKIYQLADEGRLGGACALSVYLILAVIISLVILRVIMRISKIKVLTQP